MRGAFHGRWDPLGLEQRLIQSIYPLLFFHVLIRFKEIVDPWEVCVIRSERRKYLTSQQVASLLGFATRTICYWAECGELPAVKLGRQWRFDGNAIQLWIESRQNSPASVSSDSSSRLQAYTEPPESDNLPL